MKTPKVSVYNVSKSFSGNQVVKDLSFEIYQGDFFGLLGPNGAGKTTTIGILTGLIKPSDGRLIIDEMDPTSNAKETKAKLGFVPEDFAFYPTLSAKDNLQFFGRIYGLGGKHLKRRIKDVLDIVDLNDFSGQPVSTFSNGMKRRLNIAIGLLHEPKILILDEPTVGVDAHSREAILESLTGLNNDGMSILYTTHYMEEAQRLCNRVAIMDHGCIIALDTPSALIQELGEGIIRIEFKEPVDEVLINRFSRLGPCKIVNGKGSKLHLEAKNPEQAIRELLTLTEETNIMLKTVDILEQNLESVFLHLTHRTLRD